MTYRKMAIVAMLLFFLAPQLRGQQARVEIFSNWQTYASDTLLTYRQITTICDSMFYLSGFPEPQDTSQQDSVVQQEPKRENDDDYVQYSRWKEFWATRLDAETGKLHDFSVDMLQALARGANTIGSIGTPPCPIQDRIRTMEHAEPGWRFIGPGRSTPYPADLDGVGSWVENTLSQHLGRVNKIVVNPNNQNEVYASDEWGGLWKTSNANLAPNNTWTCLTDNNVYGAGFGVQDFIVDFTPGHAHRIFVLGGYKDYQMYFYNPARTVGLFYSGDDGVNFNYLFFPASTPGETFNKLYLAPGANTLFVSAKFHIYQLGITALWAGTSTSVTSAVFANVLLYLPTDGSAGTRWAGFGEMTMFQDMYGGHFFYSTMSTNGTGRPMSANLYEWSPPMGLSYRNQIPATNVVERGELDINPWGDGMHSALSTWFKLSSGAGSWIYSPPTPGVPGNMSVAPFVGGAYSLEVSVPGSYVETTTYTITFTVTIPPGVGATVTPKLKDCVNLYGPDWNWPMTSTAYPTAVDVGPPGGITATGTYTYVVTAPHYVNRLEFGFTGGFAGTLKFENISVKTSDADLLYNITTPVAGTWDNSFYFLTETMHGFLNRAHKLSRSIIYPHPATTTTIATNPGPARSLLAVSPLNSDVVYVAGQQTDWDVNLYKLNFGIPTMALIADPSSKAYHPDARALCVMPNGAGGENVYVGNDGGIAMGKFGGPWKDLNGTGFSCSLAKGIGSSIHTGDVSIATSDNGILYGTAPKFDKWTYNVHKDGADVKYGTRYATRNMRFAGTSSSGFFTDLEVLDLVGNSPSPTPGSFFGVNAPPFGKIVTTMNGEYFGTGGGQIKSVKAIGTPPGPFTYSYGTIGSGFAKVQALAPDKFNAGFVAAFVSPSFWDAGNFVITNNATAATPAWITRPNPTYAPGLGHEEFICMAVDPRTQMPNKRMWAGAGWYRTADYQRVFQTLDGGVTWTDYSLGLPAGPVHALAYDEQSHMLFAGTDQGVFVIDVEAGPITHPIRAGTNSWQCFNHNLPGVFVTGLDINRCTGKLYASTYGRGAWEAELPPAKNWNGYTATGGLDSVDILVVKGTISAPEVWDYDRDITRTVYVGGGKALIVRNCTINMGRNKNIIVDVGGSLVLEGATITNTCGTMWGCISVMGTPGQDQNMTHENDAVPWSLNQGFLKIKPYTGTPNRNTVIEHAFMGIVVAKQDYDGSDIGNYVAGKEGGIVHADRAQIRNCASGVIFFPYGHVNHSWFSDCHFIANAPLRHPYFVDNSTGTPRKYGMVQGVLNKGTWNIAFWNDSFETVDDPTIGFTPDNDLRGKGYVGMNSYGGIHGCTFKNLYRGCHTTQTYCNYTTNIYDSKFYNCWRAISNDGQNGFVCYKNVVVNRPYITSSPSDAAAPMGIYGWVENYGSYATFHINENGVKAYSSTPPSSNYDIGIYAMAPEGNTLYRNDVQRTKWGINANGKLQAKCNIIQSTYSGLYEVSSGQIRIYGGPGNAAANLFWSGTYPWQLWVPESTYYGIVYKSKYYSYPSSGTLIYQPLPSKVRTTGTLLINASPSTLSYAAACPTGTATMYKVGTAQGELSVAAATQSLAQVEGLLAIKQGQLSAGNSISLKNLVDDLNQSSSTVAGALIQAGPYLSDDVLFKAINRTVPLDYTDIKAVVVANSALNESLVPLLNSKYQQAAVDQDIVSAQSNASSRAYLEEEIQGLLTNRNEYIDALKEYYDHEGDWKAAAELFVSRQQYELAFPYWIHDENWAEAQAMIDSIPDSSLTKLMSIHLAHAMQGLSTDSLSTEDSTTIALLSLDRGTHAGKIAYVWHTQAHNIPYYEYMPMDSTMSGDTSMSQPQAKGVLAVTEVSKGAETGCQYAEMVVANCGDDEAIWVDVSGWIIDDNSGNFNSEGCSAGNNGITPSHYRLSSDDVWKHVAIGSVIVVYNADVNCYNLPDTFTVDTLNGIYWIPIKNTMPEGNYVLERADQNCTDNSYSYCDVKEYFAANNWDGTMTLDDVSDAVQVRCPGCESANATFYHGVGYANSLQTNWSAIQPTNNSLGGAMLNNNASGPALKFEFTGASNGQFADPAYWTVAAADTAGDSTAVPATIGHVTQALYDAIAGHTFSMPCCANASANRQGGVRASDSSTVINNQGVRIYPNPAKMLLNFEFPIAKETSIRLMDITGRVVDQQVVRNRSSASFNVKTLTPGMYLYQIISDGKTVSGKVVVSQ